MNNSDKLERTLAIFFRAVRGEDLSVRRISDEYGVSTKTIARDIRDLKTFLAENRDMLGYAELQYSYRRKAYFLKMEEFLSDRELLALVKILIASRALNRGDMLSIVNKIKCFSAPEDRKMLNNMLSREMYYYSAVGSDVPHVTDRLWQISRAIELKKEITIIYYKMDRSEITRRIVPVSVMFSEYYFYLIAFHETENGMTERFYRIDRIKEVADHRDAVMSRPQFNEGELRRLNQFMFPGKNRRILFEFTGPSVQAVLDRLPTAKLIDVRNGVNIIEAQVYGDGIRMWLLSQGNWVKVLEPQELADEIRGCAERIVESYK